MANMLNNTCQQWSAPPDEEALDEEISAYFEHLESCSFCAHKFDAPLAEFLEAVDVVQSFSPRNQFGFTEDEFLRREKQRTEYPEIVKSLKRLQIYDEEGNRIKSINLRGGGSQSVKFQVLGGQWLKFYAQNQNPMEAMPLLTQKLPIIDAPLNWWKKVHYQFCGLRSSLLSKELPSVATFGDYQVETCLIPLGNNQFQVIARTGLLEQRSSVSSRCYAAGIMLFATLWGDKPIPSLVSGNGVITSFIGGIVLITMLMFSFIPDPPVPVPTITDNQPTVLLDMSKSAIAVTGDPNGLGSNFPNTANTGKLLDGKNSHKPSLPRVSREELSIKDNSETVYLDLKESIKVMREESTPKSESDLAWLEYQFSSNTNDLASLLNAQDPDSGIRYVASKKLAKRTVIITEFSRFEENMAQIQVVLLDKDGRPGSVRSWAPNQIILSSKGDLPIQQIVSIVEKTWRLEKSPPLNADEF